jgi:Na+/melibiose symporter-like transporter
MIVPLLSYVMFENLNNDEDQFAYICNFAVVIGVVAFFVFIFNVNEVVLIESSKKIYDKYFLIEPDKLGTDGTVEYKDYSSPRFLDTDSEFDGESDKRNNQEMV